MSILQGLAPEGVWHYFEELCGIPHGSHNEKAVSDYCVRFAKERGLTVYQDEAWNVVIIKEASAGYEDAEPLIIQGHLDMVCVKKEECPIDFEKDGLDLRVSGDWVYAEGTTLGGDDGIAVAYALALLDDNCIPHPRLEAVFTTCEEVGMEGASALDVSMLKGHRVLNLDSEEEGILLAGCAGGSRMEIRLPVKRQYTEGKRAVLTLTGLQGGHSGTEIDKGRGNANVLLARVLSALQGEVHYRIVSLEGGEKDNAIPTWSRAELLVPFEKTYKLEEICAVCGEELKKEYALTDPELQVQFQYGNETGGDAFDEKSTETSLAFLLALPNGVQAMSKDIPGLVETSLNLGIMRTDEKGLALSYALRSSVEAEKKHLTGKIKILTEYMGGIAETGGIYPAWEYRRDSGLREDMVRIYEKMFRKKPEIQVIHAGLECGILAAKIPNLDCVSMGPEIRDIHTAEERMSISSVRRMWEYILEIVKTKR